MICWGRIGKQRTTIKYRLFGAVACSFFSVSFNCQICAPLLWLEQFFTGNAWEHYKDSFQKAVQYHNKNLHATLINCVIKCFSLSVITLYFWGAGQLAHWPAPHHYGQHTYFFNYLARNSTLYANDGIHCTPSSSWKEGSPTLRSFSRSLPVN